MIDISTFWIEAGKLGFVVLMLLVAVYLLWKHIGRIEARRDKTDAARHGECIETNRVMGVRLTEIENSRHAEGREMQHQLLGLLGQNTRAWERLADRLSVPDSNTPPRPMPAQKG